MLTKFFNIIKKQPKLVALYAYRYDAQLVPDLVKNIEGFVDDFIEWDDRKNDQLWYHEGETREYLRNEARKIGADWVLCVDPDERFEKDAGDKIRKIIQTNQKIIYGFFFRELYKPNAYRVDDIWAHKTKYVLFPLLAGQEFMNYKAHSQWAPINSDYSKELQDINLYHFKMINPQNRQVRKNLYKKLDPRNDIQKIGYDYLTDEKNIKLEEIPKGREYFPEYKDYGLKHLGDNTLK